MMPPILKKIVCSLAACVLVPDACLAQRSPTVVFESGLGDGAKVWRTTIEALPADTAVFSYDRPGYGKAPTATTPRDPCTIASELHARLSAAGRTPPYLLVGHSLGGQYAYAFARLYPQEVSGIVLVDATPMGHWHAIQNRLPGLATMIRLMRSVVFSRTMRREFDGQEQCLSGLPQTAFPFPARVLVSTRPDPAGGEQLLEIDHELAQAWLTLTGASAVERAAGSGHYIQREQPGMLAEIIRQTLRVE